MSGEQAEGSPCAGHLSCLPKNFLRPCVLLLLDEEPAYGYELQHRLPTLTTWCDQGGMYRLLNTMEEEQLVSSRWERSLNGPSRRRYTLTAGGRDVMARWAADISAVRDLLTEFLVRYDRDVEARTGGPTVDSVTLRGDGFRTSAGESTASSA